MKNALVMLVKYYRRILFFLAASVLFSGCSVAQNNIQENNYAQNTPNYDLAMSIINHVAKCWAVPRSAIESSNVVHINIALNRNTSLKKVEVAKIDRERYKSEPEFRNLADSAITAVKRCSPMEFLSADKYDVWKDMEAIFDPRMKITEK